VVNKEVLGRPGFLNKLRTYKRSFEAVKQ
jgi:hypothetical protein